MDQKLKGKTAIVVGASRGMGLGVARALARAGAQVIAAARTAAPVTTQPESIYPEIVEAIDESAAKRLLDTHDPDIVVLAAGATPRMLPLQEQTWDSFSAAWTMDVQMTFVWFSQILKKPMRPGGRVITFSSGAALAGSALSGGYAGAKSMQRFLSTYAQSESDRMEQQLTFTSILPLFSPETEIGKVAIAAYAERAGVPVSKYLDSFVTRVGPLVSPTAAGEAVTRLAIAEAKTIEPAYRLTGNGLEPLP